MVSPLATTSRMSRQSANALNNSIASSVTFVCGLWLLSYILLSGNELGRTWFARLGQAITGDKKGGMMILFLALPILLAASVSTLFLTAPSPAPSTHFRQSVVHKFLPHWIHQWKRRGDWDLDTWALTMILGPAIVYLAMVNYHHFHGQQKGLDDRLKEMGNSFGIMAEVVGSFLLIPVSRHSSLLKVAGWSPARAIRLHIWAGRIFVIGGLAHGLFYIFRWKVLANESVINMLIPPAACWTMDNKSYAIYKPSCVDEETDCSCYDRFRNLTGFVSAFCMLVIMVTSLHQVRRQFYQLFYLSHIIAAPLALAMLIMHWNRSILFLCPSLLYYAATSAPVMVESATQCNRKKGVKVVTVEQIPSSTQNMKNISHTTHYISLTIEATEKAIEEFRPGYYVQLSAPQISPISHPFTINKVPERPNQLRIIFKAMGKFTTQLSENIQRAILEKNCKLSTVLDNMPQIYIHGYSGTPNRLNEVLQHDVAVMVAGGIGITPYLTLLHQIYDVLSNSDVMVPTKRVVLLWMCRDASLIDYIKREYLIPLQQSRHNSQVVPKIKLIIHHTCGTNLWPDVSRSDEESLVEKQKSSRVATNVSSQHDLLSVGVAFAPSRFAAGTSIDWRANVLAFISFVIIAWGGLLSTWLLYANHTHEKGITSRIWSLIAMGVLSASVAVFANALAEISFFRRGMSDEVEGAPLTGGRGLLDDIVHTKSLDIGMDTLKHSERNLDEQKDKRLISDETGGKNEDEEMVTLEEKYGRPTVHQMLKFVDGARCPGLFTCGPRELMQDMRASKEERCLLRVQHSIPGASNHIALYEEAFDM